MATGAACTIFDDLGLVLLLRHTYGRLNWELPGGGALQGESPKVTARRELFEDTGLESAIERLTGVYYEPDHEDGSMLHFVFRCRSDPLRVPVPSSPEIGDDGFWPRDALPAPMSDFTERRLREACAEGAAAVVTI